MKINIRAERFVPRYTTIRNFKTFNPTEFKTQEFYFATVYVLEDPNERLEVFNSLILKCIDEHAPLAKCKKTRPPSPWMKDININDLSNQCTAQRDKPRRSCDGKDWNMYRKTRNQLKKAIKTAKNTFYRKLYPPEDQKKYGRRLARY